MLKRINILLLMIAATSVMLNAEQVSETQARALASQFFNTSLPVQAPAMKSKIKGKAGSTPYYVYNNPEQPGWVIIAGDDRARSILAYGDEYYFDKSEVPECVQEWLDDYAQQIVNLDASSSGSGQAQSMSSFAASNKTRIAPLLQSNMAQGLPYNQECPSVGGKLCVTGCVATAMAQILYYYKSSTPTAVIPAYTTKTNKIERPELPSTTFNYSIINGWYDNEANSTAGANEVAKLIKYCGQSVQMDYKTDVSSALSQVQAFTKYFGYDINALYASREDYSASDWENLIYTELSAGRPVYLTARKLTGGHAFICDGYDNGLYHINWGWRGHQNGYFSLNAMSDGNSGGTGAASGSEGYTLEVKAMIGLQPSLGNTGNNNNGSIVGLYQDCVVPTTPFTRSNSNENFTGVNPYAYYDNTSNQVMTYDLGYGLYDSKGDFIEYLIVVNNKVMQPRYYYYPEASLSFGKGFADGKYYLYPVCRVSGTEVFHLCQGANMNYIEATITGNTMTLTSISRDVLENLKVNSLTTSPLVKVGSPMTLTLNVTNQGYTDYSYIYMWVDNDGTSATTTDLAPNETGDVVFNYISPTSGNRTFKFTKDSDGEKVLYTTQINVAQTTPANISADVQAQVNYTTINTSATVTNNHTNTYNDYILARLYKKEPNSGNTGYLCGAKSQLVNLASGASTTVNFTFDNLEFPETYFVIYFYYSNGSRVRIKATPNQNTVSPFDKLDVNQDGIISSVDVSAIYDVLLNNNRRFKPYADVNGDGEINAVDITIIYNKLLGL